MAMPSPSRDVDGISCGPFDLASFYVGRTFAFQYVDNRFVGMTMVVGSLIRLKPTNGHTDVLGRQINHEDVMLTFFAKLRVERIPCRGDIFVDKPFLCVRYERGRCFAEIFRRITYPKPSSPYLTLKVGYRPKIEKL